MKKKRIVVNGREYGSVDEMPPEVRHTYEELMAGSAEGDTPSSGTSGATPAAPREGEGPAELDTERIYAMLRSAEPRRTRLSRGIGMAVAFGAVLVFVLAMLVLGSL